MRQRLSPRSLLARFSPRRRLLVGGLAALLFAGLVAAGALVAVHSAPALRRAAAPAERYPPQDRPGPVLLVPGYGGGTDALRVLARRLRDTGREAEVVSLPGDATGDLTAQARALDRAVAAALRRGAPSVDLVGYSAGGVVTRLWVTDFDGAHKARRVVTLGSPHHGTRVAALGAAFAPDDCPLACQQLVPGSSLLARLDRDPVGEHPRWLSLWTTGDQVVVPPESAQLTGGTNVALQRVCPDERVDHGRLPTSRLVAGIVLGALGSGPVPDPAARDCRTLRTAGGR